MSPLKFSQERLLKVILGPVVSEKATEIANARSQFAFRVATDATKAEIKSAIEMLFQKDVDSVQVVHVKGKKKRTGQRIGQRKNWKKAYVCLKPGQDIDLTSGEVS
ncbi:MAG: 50S ribosomal protein L23 [Proteobacteria bacterium]|nr:50S ribosomal protein L23 [Pseudomonadota bacterium]